jgi:hypothetical protein
MGLLSDCRGGVPEAAVLAGRATRLALRWATIACPVGMVYLWQRSTPIDTEFGANKAEAVNVPFQCLGRVILRVENDRRTRRERSGER